MASAAVEMEVTGWSGRRGELLVGVVVHIHWTWVWDALAQASTLVFLLPYSL